MRKLALGFAAMLAAASLGGCATWSDSHVTTSKDNAEAAKAAKAAPKTPDQVTLSENDITDRSYTVLGDIKVTVNKTTIFNKDPTREQVNDKLKERAAELGADAVVLVRYGSVGVSFMSWGELDGEGRAIKFNN